MSASTTLRSGHSELVITPSQLAALPSSTTVPIDVTWFMPNVARNPNEEFLGKRIPDARRMDLDVVASEHPLGLKHMMPTGEVFAKACEEIGVSPASHVVLYDTHGVFSSPRALFMFKAFGHSKASILNGGLPRWVDEGHPTESGPLKAIEPAKYPAPTLKEDFVRDYEHIVKATTSNDGATVVLDARPNGRFTGKDPEPRPNLSSGHMPSSRSLPFSNLLARQQPSSDGSSYTTLLEPNSLLSEVEKVVGEHGLDGLNSKQVINSCGSGMTAAVIWLALQELGVNSSLYDESWTGYAMRPESKVLKNE
ncbi:hypothetical protein M407DRAFT_193496 [Tulasnella calospora MUT 4182]|uniref:Rhodanese domain-containing protein n=1 Tax=Tulasnella calospora MUT 4182 TaxID=1051891 RepID=A0A0C3L0N2_9AGAM|nr:hypothetical protein M407DRAFT_193496 [Tulasnella calospora MUT 4182]